MKFEQEPPALGTDPLIEVDLGLHMNDSRGKEQPLGTMTLLDSPQPILPSPMYSPFYASTMLKQDHLGKDLASPMPNFEEFPQEHWGMKIAPEDLFLSSCKNSDVTPDELML